MKDAGSSLTALVVDDQVDIRDFFCTALEMYGFQVLQAENGEEALKTLRENPNLSLLVTDVLMPGGDGFELLQSAREIRRERGGKPSVLVISGGGLYETGQFYLDSAEILGADLTLMKPVSVRDLHSALTKLGFDKPEDRQFR